MAGWMFGARFVFPACGIDAEFHVQTAAPIVAMEPADQTRAAGETVLLTARVLGREPIYYQWFADALPLSRANSYTLVISNAQIAQSGLYFLTASNLYGRATSRVARVKILDPIVIEQPFTSNTITPGRAETLQVQTAGSKPSRYQWRLNGVNVPMATNSLLALNAFRIKDAGLYSVLVKGEMGVKVKLISDMLALANELAPGDMFSERVPLKDSNKVVRSANRGATREPGEPYHAGKIGRRSIWFSWTAPTSAWVSFSTEGSNFDTLLAVYAGSQVNQLNLVASDDDKGGFHTSQVRFMAESGAEYLIAVDGLAESAGVVMLSWDIEPTALLIPHVVAGPASQLAPRGGEARFMLNAKGKELRYQWYFDDIPLIGETNSSLFLKNVQPKQAGLYRVQVRWRDRQLGMESAKLEVYEISDGIPDAQELGRDKIEDLVMKPLSPVPGSQQVGLLHTASPQGPAPSSGYTITQWSNNGGNSTQSYEAGECGEIGGASQWFHLVLSKAGVCTLSTEGSGFDTLLAVYHETGDLMNPLAEFVACDDNSGADGKTSRLQFPVLSADSFFVLVDGVNGVSGNIQLTTTLEPWAGLISAGIDATGTVVFTLGVPTGWVFRIDGAPDFASWFPLLTTNAPKGRLSFNDSDWDLFSQRYYRVVPVE